MSEFRKVNFGRKTLWWGIALNFPLQSPGPDASFSQSEV